MRKDFFKIVFLSILFCLVGSFVFAGSLEEKTFFVDPNFAENLAGPTLKAIHILTENGLDFYIDTNFWDEKTEEEQEKAIQDLKDVSQKFIKSQAKVVSIFGSGFFTSYVKCFFHCSDLRLESAFRLYV
jgi:hypothetical protein